MLLQLNPRRADAPEDLVSLLMACHQRIRHFIGLALELGLSSAAPPHEVAQACLDVARYFRDSLPLHVADEDESIEPRLRRHAPELDSAFTQMAREHQEHALLIRALLDALGALAERPSAPEGRAQLAAIAGPLKVELESHLLLEERSIFPAIESRLPIAEQTAIVEELRARRR